MANNFQFHESQLDSPGRSLSAVTPHDSNDITNVARALWVGVGGDISIIAAGDDSAVVLKNVPSGSLVPIMTARVRATSTTATDIVAIE